MLMAQDPASPATRCLRIAAAGDVHCSESRRGEIAEAMASLEGTADLVLLAGDLTTHGEPAQAAVLAEACAPLALPVLAVLGNHDFEGGQPETVKQILCDAGITMLDGDAVEIEGVGFAGTKGFCGGFGRRSLEPWGEPAIKAFVREALDEALKLESGLARLRTPHKIALLHYAPIQTTVEGEPPEIFPFLGSSRLEDPINRYNATAVLHGHAHHGSPEGRTTSGVPVYNVSMPLLKRHFPNRPAFRVLEVPRQAPAAADGQVPHAEALTDRLGVPTA
jgi:Icc-related predicted phosphoesterase